MKTTADRFEAYLRGEGLPYVSMGDAPRSDHLPSFHFVVYRECGDNWLAWARQRITDADRLTMQKWQGVFGAGFKAVWVHQSDGLGWWNVTDVAGPGWEILGDEPAAPLPLQAALAEV